MKPKKKCCFYTRVSTTMQVDGCSLDVQSDKSLCSGCRIMASI